MVERIMIYQGYPIVTIFTKSGYRDTAIGIPKKSIFYGIDFKDPCCSYTPPSKERIQLCDFTATFFDETEDKQYWWVWLFGDLKGDCADVKSLIDLYEIDKNQKYLEEVIDQMKYHKGNVIMTLEHAQAIAQELVDWMITEEHNATPGKVR